MKEKKFKFTAFIDGQGRKEIYERTESELTDAEKYHQLGLIISVWKNTCGWAQMEFLKKLTPHLDSAPMTNSEILERLNEVLPPEKK